MFTLTISTDNAAFEGDSAPDEVARILRQLADDVRENGFAFPLALRDVNGNRVGAWSLGGDASSLTALIAQAKESAIALTLFANNVGGVVADEFREEAAALMAAVNKAEA